MAVRNHLLDSKIKEAAVSEFSEKGYREASMRKIASLADVTVGAIYTRYRTKDILFLSCVNELLAAIRETHEEVVNRYNARPRGGVEAIIEHIRCIIAYETDAAVSVLLEYPEQTKLLLTRSQGSSLEHFFDTLINDKVKSSIELLHEVGIENVDEKLLRMTIALHYHSVVDIFDSGCDMQEARRYLDVLTNYHIAGFNAIFYDICPRKKKTSE